METLEDPDGDYYLALPRGTMLMEYRIESVLGQGGFGITYLAINTMLEQEVAIKEYFPNENAIRTRDLSARAKSPQDREPFETGLEDFLEEARTIAKFRHRNIMQVLRFFKAHGTGYIVLQFEHGRSFEDVVAAGPLPEAELLPIMAGLLDGLNAIHESAILHRDIKPRNVIIRPDGTPVLIDFGAARDFSKRDSKTVTKMASPGYSPPEQYGVGSQPGPWSDFYALGAMMYRAATGKVPADSLRRLRNDPLIPAIQIAGKSYSKALLRAIDHMMQIDERNRPASVAEIRAVLAPLSPLFGPVVREVRSPPAARAPAQVEARKSSPKIPLPMIAGGGLVLVLGLAGAVFFLTRSPEAERPRDEPILLPAEPPVALPPPPAVKAGLVPGTFFRDCPTCPELVVLPPGQFKMGADDGFPSEEPAHEVAIPAAIAIGRDPVTFAEWDACVADGGCAYRPGDQGWGRETRPVINVSWNDAQAYLGWLSKTTNQHYRLPSEAEWEYAARAGTTTAYWWDDDPGEGHAICADCSSLKPVSTEPVASLPPNPFGLYGMAGNVAQWVQECWTESYTDAVASGGACKTRVLRGGSFKSDARYVRVSARTRQDADFRYYANGFRVARDGG